MNQISLIYYRNVILFILGGVVLGFTPAFILVESVLTPSVDGFTLIVNNLELIIDPEIKKIVSDSNISESTEETIIEDLKLAQGKGLVLANNLMSFFMLYVFGAFCLIFIPIYLGVKISMKLYKKWFPIDMDKIKSTQQSLESGSGKQ